MPLTADKVFKIKVSDDRLTAVLSLNADVSPVTVPSIGEVLSQLNALHIVLDENAESAVQEYLDSLGAGKIPNPIVIATGTPARHDQEGKLDKLFEQEDPPDVSDKADDYQEPSDDIKGQSHYDRKSFFSVDCGAELIRIIPPVAGEDGTDVYGKPITHKVARDAEIHLGSNVKQQGDLVLATCGGKVEFSGNKISVNPKLMINSDVDFSVGNIDFCGEVAISKNVLDLFKVHSDLTITIHGVVEAAELSAKQDIVAIGGMAGKEKGHFTAGHDIKAKYITNSYVRAGNNITVRTEVVNCDLACKGVLTIENGPLVGGHVVATSGAKLRQLGSDVGTKTLLEVGIDDSLRAKVEQIAPEVAQRRRKVNKVRQAVEPLLQNQKYLLSEQKEKATELLYQASELEDAIDELIGQVRSLYEETAESGLPEVEITGTLFAGATIRFPKVEAFVERSFKGPLKVVAREIDNSLCIVLIDGTSGTTHDMGASCTPGDFWEQLDNLLEVKSD